MLAPMKPEHKCRHVSIFYLSEYLMSFSALKSSKMFHGNSTVGSTQDYLHTLRLRVCDQHHEKALHLHNDNKTVNEPTFHACPHKV